MPKKKSAPQLISRNTTPNPKEDSKSGGREMKILLAEDNKTNQVVAVRMLLMEKITNVDVAADGQIALDMVTASIEKQSGYDIILMDVQMPNMDGLEATRFIREKGFKGPIIALSAYADAANVKNCKDAGMDDFVSKPIQLTRLRQILNCYYPVNRPTERSDTRMQPVSAPSSYYKAPATSKGDNTTLDTEDG
jgi:osomolarity two-component system sensor histidine kinase SLN1